jgi:hypothetical protein
LLCARGLEDNDAVPQAQHGGIISEAGAGWFNADAQEFLDLLNGA